MDYLERYQEFWNWFAENANRFHTIVKDQRNIEQEFFPELAENLSKVRENFFYLVGMYDDDTVELIITVDGAIENIVFAEELINAAPQLLGWRFVALKQATDISDVSINIGNYCFDSNSIQFVPRIEPSYPDDIDLNIVFDSQSGEDSNAISVGVSLFLENYLGELQLATQVDSFTVLNRSELSKEPVPISKLDSYLTWRQAEFVEKYEGVWHDSENDSYAAFEGKLSEKKALIAVLNTDLLDWDRKASHSWIAVLELHFDGEQRNGMPDEETYALLEEIEDKLLAQLVDHEGYLNVGRQTADGVREIYFACKEFRQPSKAFDQIRQVYSEQFEVDYYIYQDKYWRLFDRFGR
ncbi:DUF695 domain-containing protein [Hymenobacter busanensis]|nr:DUF695 domain-containing protein [Hymenobacter busanensis]QHJ06318.1 DUF695 domain-containing protein [Hymenobacter busanensis]